MISVTLLDMTPEGDLVVAGTDVVAPPLGLLHIAGAMRDWCSSRPGIIVNSLSVSTRRMEEVSGLARKHRPDIVGLGARTVDGPRLLACAGLIRAELPECILVAGGPLATVHPEKCLASGAVDWAVIGEGERPMAMLVDSIVGGSDPRLIPGLAWLDDDHRLSRSTPSSDWPDLDLLPVPAWDLCKFPAHARLPGPTGLAPLTGMFATLSTVRGTQGTPRDPMAAPASTRWMSVGRIIEYMQSITMATGISEFHFLDEPMGWDPGRLSGLSRAISDAGMPVKLAFPCGLRGDAIDRETLRDLARAGCYFIAFVVPPSSPRFRRAEEVGVDVDGVMKTARLATDLGIITRAFARIGHPGETQEQMRKAVDAVLQGPFDLPLFETARPSTDGEADNVSRILARARDEAFEVPWRQERISRIRAMIPHDRDRPWIDDLLSVAKPTVRQPHRAEPSRVVLAMFHTMARSGRFAGNIQLSILSGHLGRLGVEHELIAIILHPGDDENNRITIKRFLDRLVESRPEYVVFYSMWLPWIAQEIEDRCHARVLSLDAAQPGSILEAFSGIDPQLSVLFTIAGPGTEVDVLEKIAPDDPLASYAPRFDYTFIGDDPLPQVLGFLSLSGCPYDRRIDDNPRFAGIVLPGHVSRCGCSYCNSALRYVPMDGDSRFEVMVHQVRYMQEHIPTLEEIAVPFPEDHIVALTRLVRESDRLRIRPIVFSGQFRSESLAGCEQALDDLIEACARTGFAFHVNVVGLESFSDDDLELYNRGTSKSVIEALRVIARLRARHQYRSFMPSTVGSFILFHPWQSIEGLEHNARMMRTHGVVGSFDTININDLRFHTGVPLYHLARKDGLLEDVDPGIVQDVPLGGYFSESPWRFASAETAGVHRLFSHLAHATQDRHGLLESCLRLARDPDRIEAADPVTIQVGLERLCRMITRSHIPVHGRHVLLGIGSRTNTGDAHDIWQGRRYEDRLEEAIREAHAIPDEPGLRVTIGGPEPTLLSWLLEFVSRLRARPAIQVDLLTNGRMLVYPAYTARLIMSRPNLVSVLVHHCEASVHDGIVRVEGAFRQATAGMSTMRRMGHGVGVGTALVAVAGARSRGQLASMARLAAVLGASEFRIAVPLCLLDLGRLQDLEDECLSALQVARLHGMPAGFDRHLSLTFRLPEEAPGH